MDLADQVAAVWARRLLVLTVGLVVATAVFVWRATVPDVFESTETLRVQAPASASGDPEQVDFFANTVIGLVTSTDVVDEALSAIGSDAGPVSTSKDIDAQSGAQDGFVEITVGADTAAESASLVDALATAVAQRVADDQVGDRPALTNLIAEVERERDELSTGNASARRALDRVRGSLEEVLRQSAGVDTWRVTTVVDAEEPREPVSPAPARDALLAFLVAAILVAEGIVAQRAWRGAISARDPAGDVAAQLGVPAVAVRSEDRPGALAPLLSPLTDEPRVTVVQLGRRPGALVAVRLTALLAERGREVLLVDASPSRPAVHQELGLGATPGLTDLPTGKLDLRRRLGALPRVAGARVLTAGSADKDPGEPARQLERLAATDVDVLVLAVSVDLPSDLAGLLDDAAADPVVLDIDASMTRTELRTHAEALRGLGARLVAASVSGGDWRPRAVRPQQVGQES